MKNDFRTLFFRTLFFGAPFFRTACSPNLRCGRWLLLVLAAGLLLATSASVAAQIAQAEPAYTGDDRIEDWTERRILVVTPHPDDETFTSGGTLARLAENGNEVHILIYTSDNAGSRDPEMTHERLAAIRKVEEENACRILGLDPGRITWLGHDDGMLEYVDRRELTRQVAQEIRRVRPHAIFSVDPGAPYEQYHKSDHRSAAFITVDAIRAARWRLYFPELEEAGFAAWNVPVAFFYYSAQPNYEVDVTAYAERKSRAAAAHTSQFDPLVDRYDPALITEEHLASLAKGLLSRAPRQGGRAIEKFRRSEAY